MSTCFSPGLGRSYVIVPEGEGFIIGDSEPVLMHLEISGVVGRNE